MSTIHVPARAPAAFVLLAVLALAFGLACLAPVFAGNETRIATQRAAVARFGLTDLALFNAARYARHPSQADLFAPFQDAPQAREHFPAGAIVMPPAHLPAGTLATHAPVANP